MTDIHESRPSRQLWLIADDFAQSEPIDRAILELAGKGLLSGTSVFAESAACRERAPDLRACTDLAVGMHFSLTHSIEGRLCWSLTEVWRRSFLRQWSAQDLQKLWHAQLDAFEQALGRAPDYVDGHQHVHQLPQIREAMLHVLQERYGRVLPLRSTVMRSWRGLKAWVIQFLGGKSLPAHSCMNEDFAGVYHFEATAFEQEMQRWLDTLVDRGLIMCHPGHYDPDDVLCASRPREYEALASGWFEAQCRLRGLELLRRADLGTNSHKESMA